MTRFFLAGHRRRPLTVDGETLTRLFLSPGALRVSPQPGKKTGGSGRESLAVCHETHIEPGRTKKPGPGLFGGAVAVDPSLFGFLSTPNFQAVWRTLAPEREKRAVSCAVPRSTKKPGRFSKYG